MGKGDEYERGEGYRGFRVTSKALGLMELKRRRFGADENCSGISRIR